MKIKDIEVDFDFLDADDVERFEKAAKKVKEECSKHKNISMSYAEAIREECKVINTFFDEAFGQGISEKIFGKKSNLTDHIETFEAIIMEKNRQQASLKNTFDRYQPNRQQRRNNNKYRNYKR